MKYAENILGLVGHTPLVKLNRLADARMATVLAKLENLNPGGSVKDRMAINMVRRAEEAGLLEPGATLVESTSGNTGLGLAMTAAVRGIGPAQPTRRTRPGQSGGRPNWRSCGASRWHSMHDSSAPAAVTTPLGMTVA